jgi:SAM-dependent methyltransferase
MFQAEIEQKGHFDSIAGSYYDHYNDKYSTLYRNRFCMKPLFEGIELKKARILDAMCGSGQITEFLVNKDCYIEALDISPKQVEIYKREFPGIPIRERSILSTGYPGGCFDIVAIFGGLHHVHPHVREAVDEVHRILKPGGFLLFGEPHCNSIADRFRKLWYRRDPLFGENERAIDFDRLAYDFRDRFDVISVFYGGNVGYLLVYNSLIMRIPVKVKVIISPSLLVLERVILHLQNRLLSFYGIMQWQKR